MKHMIFLVLVLLVGCSNSQPSSSETAMCGKDTDCKGERICEKGVCVTPANTVLPVNDVKVISETATPEVVEGLPVCQTENETRTPVLRWSPEVLTDARVTQLPPSSPGQIVYVDIFADMNDVQCDSEALNSLSVPDNPNDVMEGGVAVNIRGGTHFANGSCYIRGYFLHESVPGMHQGWSEMYLGEVPRKDVVLSPKLCMTRE